MATIHEGKDYSDSKTSWFSNRLLKKTPLIFRYVFLGLILGFLIWIEARYQVFNTIF